MLKMWLVEISHGIILYENRETNEICLYHVTPHPQLLESAKKKCQSLQLFKMQGVRPKRAYKNDKEKECLSCEFKITCWTQK